MNMIIKTIRHLLYYFSLYSWASWVIMKNTLRLPFLPPAGINKIFSGYCSKFMSWVNFIISIDYKVKGQENVPLDRPLIIAVKHQSGYEAVDLNTILPPSAFLVKKQLAYAPVIGLASRLTSQVFVDRKKHNNTKELEKQVQERFDLGLSLCVFPEGTRTAPGDHNTHYKKGAAYLAQNLKVDILPVAHNAGEFYARGFFKFPGTVQFSILPPIPWDAAEDATALTELLKKTIENEQKKIEGAGPSFPKKSPNLE